MYRIIPLRMLRRTPGVKFDEMVPSDIPKISGIDRVIHGPNSISPGPIEDSNPPVKRPWYMHPGQDDNLLVLQGTRYIDIFDPKTVTKASFIVTPDKVYKNDKLYYIRKEFYNYKQDKSFGGNKKLVKIEIEKCYDSNTRLICKEINITRFFTCYFFVAEIT